MRTNTALLVVALAVVGVGAAGVTTASVAPHDAPPEGATTPQSPTDATALQPSTDATALQSPTDATARQSATDSTPENLSVSVNTPRTVAKNVTQNYSVAVDGADGNVTVTWTFDGETKNGTTVQHTWDDGGNATISVTVVDGSGASVTKERTVEIAEYGSADDDPAESTPFRAIGSIVIILAAMVIFPAVLYLFVLPTVMSYMTDEFS
ncbi:PKD domain-containing protein [Halorubellus sp. PRR65]|uniref:PKD domain-containing protein n=1 Tax=Halorubellus sp. PRR65 TaxID=3098148 RepID=UPI002B2625A8|nr:PKD domain-containing protein [Halorubellus sp. PRR65]